MTALSQNLLLLTLTFAACRVNGQVGDQVIRQIVLEKAIVDSSFIFGKWTEKGGTETHLTYLGQVTTKHGQTFRVLNSIWFWGLSRRATAGILIFTADNAYVGKYSVTVISDLPTKLKNGNLIFKNSGNDCEPQNVTVVDLKNGLPKQFFKKCHGAYGDIYCFDNE